MILGLMRLDRDVEFHDKVQPIKLSTDSLTTYDNLSARMAGWGSAQVCFYILILFVQSIFIVSFCTKSYRVI